MYRTLFTIMFCIAALRLDAQIPKYIAQATEEFDAKLFTVSKDPAATFAGVYHFGESEGEWDLLIIPYKDSLLVQMWSGEWGKDAYTGGEAWLIHCETHNVVKVDGPYISFGPHRLMAANYEKSKKALLMFWDANTRDSAEVGFYSKGLPASADEAQHWDLSLKVQPETYFAGKTKQQLKIMRNTILAKYGLIFQAGGEMEKYFRKQGWYKPHLKDVSRCLTLIELKNIATIQRLEL